MIDSGYVTAENKKVDASIADRFGMISGSGIGGLSTIERNSVVYVKQKVQEKFLLSLFLHLCKYVKWIYSIEHNLRGPSLSHVTACAASTHALNDAVKQLW